MSSLILKKKVHYKLTFFFTHFYISLLIIIDPTKTFYQNYLFLVKTHSEQYLPIGKVDIDF